MVTPYCTVGTPTLRGRSQLMFGSSGSRMTVSLKMPVSDREEPATAKMKVWFAGAR